MQDGSGGWWAAATELLERETPNSGADVASYIRDTLSESDRCCFLCVLAAACAPHAMRLSDCQHVLASALQLPATFAAPLAGGNIHIMHLIMLRSELSCAAEVPCCTGWLHRSRPAHRTE